MRSCFRIITLVLAAQICCACNRGTSAGGGTLLVRDAVTLEPVSDATIRITPLHFYLPVEPFIIIDPFADNATVARTDANGTASIAIDGPARVTVLVPGRVPVTLELNNDALTATAPDHERSLDITFER